jgi:mannose-6-phosphate isomerase
VADGPLAGTTLRDLLRQYRGDLLGDRLARYDTFPLLLKFIDAREPLSVQVHPNDQLAQSLAGVPRGKTEAWVVLHAEPRSRIYAGLKAGVGRRELERALADGTTADCLHSFEPQVGDCVFFPAGTVHALGGGITIFEVQQTSDTTYRLFDWDRTDPKTGRPRELHVEKALASIDFARGPVGPVSLTDDPTSGGLSEQLVRCDYFVLRRFHTASPTYVGVGQCRILVALNGRAVVEHGGQSYPLRPYDVMLLPPAKAKDGAAMLRPDGMTTFLDCWPL